MYKRQSYDVEDCIQPLMAMSKCAAPEIEPVDIDVTDTVASVSYTHLNELNRMGWQLNLPYVPHSDFLKNVRPDG